MKRMMTVTYAPGDGKSTPMIRLANRFLTDSGFQIGSEIEVKYGNEVITISKFNQNYERNSNKLSVQAPPIISLTKMEQAK
ncbi:MAG TPA: SymE family type I addiction module toxin [Candidatus Paceibacterota bacterium]